MKIVTDDEGLATYRVSLGVAAIVRMHGGPDGWSKAERPKDMCAHSESHPGERRCCTSEETGLMYSSLESKSNWSFLGRNRNKSSHYHHLLKRVLCVSSLCVYCVCYACMCVSLHM